MSAAEVKSEAMTEVPTSAIGTHAKQAAPTPSPESARPSGRTRNARDDIVVTGGDGTQVTLRAVTGHLDQVLGLASFVKNDDGRFELSFKSLFAAFLAIDDDLTEALIARDVRERALQRILERREPTAAAVLAAAQSTPVPAAPGALTATRSAVAYFQFATNLQRENPAMGRLGVKHLLAAMLYSDARTSVQHRGELEATLGLPLKPLSEAFLRRLGGEAPASLAQVHAAMYGLDSVPKADQGMSAHIQSDVWTTVDTLGYDAYAYAIARFLLNRQTLPPLTISIQAPWGGGKTSLMRMIQAYLDPWAVSKARDRMRASAESGPASGKTSLMRRMVAYLSWALSKARNGMRASAEPGTASRPGPAEKGLSVGQALKEMDQRLSGDERVELPKLEHQVARDGMVTVWFNAWKYESANQVWSGLADAILQQVPERLSREERERFWLRLNLSRMDLAKAREKLHQHFFNRVFKSASGLMAAGGAAAFAALAAWASDAAARLEAALVGSGGAAWVASLVASLVALVAIATKTATAAWKADKEPVAEVLKDLVVVPRYDEQLGFVHQVERDLRLVFDALPRRGSQATPANERQPMVIFIDDLDRCSPAKIAQVLEAINLFLAGEFPDCFFVIGMDTEMVAAALQTAHKDMIANLPADSRIPVGWRFMDKFVQLPFIIPPSGVEAERDFVARLFVGSDGGSRTDAAAGPQAADTTPANASRGADREARAVRSKEIIGRGIEAFREDNPDIRKHVDGAARFFQGNPRDMKRFVNAFRFHYLLWWARRSQELPVPPLDALVGWTILAMKWPEHVRWLRRIESKRLAGDALVRAFGSAAPNDPSGNTNHLAVVEHASHKAADDLEAWASTMRQLYEIRPESGWLADRSLLAFYAARADEPLSAFAGKGFW